jgi:acetyl/propionyl-CoA carboxylase alpha subunit
MNTRLQVEHPITELVTGVDLVEAQLAVAAGQPLPWTAAEVAPRGHAIECRVYAEDPGSDYLPQAGTIVGYHEPAGPGIRIDSGVGAGSDVPVHYDPLLAKLAAAGRTREEARRRAYGALGEFAVLGLQTNIGLLRRVLAHDAFVTADLHTGFLAEHEKALIGAAPDEIALAAVAAAASAVQSKQDRRTSAGGGSRADRHPPGETVLDEQDAGVWSRLAGWRLGADG